MGRILWSLDFWPEWPSDSVCPEESIYLQTGPSGHYMCHPSPHLPPKRMLVTVLPLGISHTESRGSWGSLPLALQIQDLLFAHLPSPCSLGSPVCSGPASARPLPVCCLALAPVCICISPLPGPTLQHRLSPALVSRICTWHVVLYCVLGVFVVTAGPGFTLAQQPRWVGDLMGKTQ